MWLDAHRVRLPAPEEFERVCAAARTAMQPGHPVYWQTLRELVQQDEIKCQSVRSGHRMLPWLAEDVPACEQNRVLAHESGACYGGSKYTHSPCHAIDQIRIVENLKMFLPT